jgi:hypothetical protein
MGDSKIIIDWYTNNSNLQVISLRHWMIKIRALSIQFQHIKGQHIYRTYNQGVDRLLKEALSLEEGGIYWSQDVAGQQDTFVELKSVLRKNHQWTVYALLFCNFQI